MFQIKKSPPYQRQGGKIDSCLINERKRRFINQFFRSVQTHYLSTDITCIYSRIFMTATKRSFMKKKMTKTCYQKSFFVYPAVISSCYRNKFELTISILCLTFFFSSRNCDDCYCLCRCKNFTFVSHGVRFNPIFIHTSMYVSV